MPASTWQRSASGTPARCHLREVSGTQPCCEKLVRPVPLHVNDSVDTEARDAVREPGVELATNDHAMRETGLYTGAQSVDMVEPGLQLRDQALHLGSRQLEGRCLQRDSGHGDVDAPAVLAAGTVGPQCADHRAPTVAPGCARAYDRGDASATACLGDAIDVRDAVALEQRELRRVERLQAGRSRPDVGIEVRQDVRGPELEVTR